MCMTIYNTLDTGALIGLDNSNIYISQTVLLNWTVRLAIQCVGLVLYSGVWLMDTPEISHTPVFDWFTAVLLWCLTGGHPWYHLSCVGVWMVDTPEIVIHWCLTSHDCCFAVMSDWWTPLISLILCLSLTGRHPWYHSYYCDVWLPDTPDISHPLLEFDWWSPLILLIRWCLTGGHPWYLSSSVWVWLVYTPDITHTTVMSDWRTPLIFHILCWSLTGGHPWYYSSCDGVWLVDTPEISHTVMSASLSYTHTNYLVTRGHFPWVCILWPLETPKENWGLLQTNSSGVLGWLQYRSKQKLGFTGRRSIKKTVLFKGKALFQCA